jgi:hypothetical protein
MGTTETARTVGAARIFMQRPDRLTALWRRERANVPSTGGQLPLLDGVVEGFIRELGATLNGAAGHPWSRTHGVLRLSSARGPRALYEEFASLRRFVLDALDALGGEAAERRMLNAAIDDAVDSAVGLLRDLESDVAAPSTTPQLRVPFGGLVVELFEHVRPQPARAANEEEAEQDALH